MYDHEFCTKSAIYIYIYTCLEILYYIGIENAASTLRVKKRNEISETQTEVSIIKSIMWNATWGLMKKITAIERDCQSLNCAKAPSC